MNKHNRIRALVFLESQESRKGVLDRLASLGDRVAVVAVVGGFYEALPLLEHHRPELLVVDTGKREDGPRLTRFVKKRWPGVWVILFFTTGDRCNRECGADFALPLWSDDQLFQDSFDQIAQTVARQRRFLTAYTQRPGLPHQPETPEQEIRRFIEENYRLPLSVELLAERFNYAPGTIGRIFRNAFGVSPMQYQIQLRIAQAKRLMLRSPDMKIREVAGAVGYSDARYFSRVFRKKNGCTPSEWLDKHGVGAKSFTKT